MRVVVNYALCESNALCMGVARIIAGAPHAPLRRRPFWPAQRPAAPLEQEGPATHPLVVALDVRRGVVVQTLEVEPIRGLEVALDHAASTAFQISGAVLYLMRSLSSLN